MGLRHANAYQANNIFYSKGGEVTNFPDRHIDLITVAQAIHWFDIPKFYDEVKRVGRQDSWLAVWGYSLLNIAPGLDEEVHHFYTQVVGPYWDPERKLIDKQYQTIPFPFEEIPAPEFKFSFDWTLNEFEGYINTWSSVQKYIKANQINPVDTFIRKIRPLWKNERERINFPLFLRLGKLSP